MADKVRVEITMDLLQLSAVEEFRRRQPVIPSRSEALRDLIESGLEAESATA